MRGEGDQGVRANLGNRALVIRAVAPRLECGLHLGVKECADEGRAHGVEVCGDVRHPCDVLGDLKGAGDRPSSFAGPSTTASWRAPSLRHIILRRP